MGKKMKLTKVSASSWTPVSAHARERLRTRELPSARRPSYDADALPLRKDAGLGQCGISLAPSDTAEVRT